MRRKKHHRRRFGMRRVPLGWLIVGGLLFVLGLGLLMTAPKEARAHESCAEWRQRPLVNRYWPHDVVMEGYCVRRYRGERVYAYRRPRSRVYGYERREGEPGWSRRDPDTERGVSCKGDPVRVVGDAHVTEKGAMDSAVRQWQATVRYDAGEKWMSVENARGYRWRCDRASTNETTLGRIGEAVAPGSGFQKRCVVIATPCMQPTARGDKDER